MENYEVNVLTRKGGWKKLPQEVISSENDLKSSKSENLLNINVSDESLDHDKPEDLDSNLFENFTEINSVINKLKSVENEKNILINKLDELMKNFENRKKTLDKKLLNIQKEKEMYDKAINLISSLKSI